MKAWIIRCVKQCLARLLAVFNKAIVSYYDPESRRIFKLIRKISQETELLLKDNEAYQLYVAVKAASKIAGELAEVGVYRGGSAKIMCEAKGNKKLYLFDTFTGLSNVGVYDPSYLRNGQYRASAAEVRAYLKNYPEVFIYEGFFPDSASGISTVAFSLVHLDVDTYDSTKACLSYFYPRIRGGVDYWS